MSGAPPPTQRVIRIGETGKRTYVHRTIVEQTADASRAGISLGRIAKR